MMEYFGSVLMISENIMKELESVKFILVMCTTVFKSISNQKVDRLST